ncbi:MAG: exosortase-associated EpsI family protein [Pedosphaera sp.]|nr:exosortase-associated EpsI family protein [Pedosphaera sp.]
MNRDGIKALVAVVVLIALSAGLLVVFKSRQKLGKPGLKVVEKAMNDEHGKAISLFRVELPEKILDYSSTNETVKDVELGYLPKDTTYGRRGYFKEDGFLLNRLDLSVVLMGTDRTSIHKPQFCLTGQGFKITEQERVTIPIDQPHQYELPAMKLTATQELKLRNGGTVGLRAIYVYWFVSENRLTAEHKSRMWLMVEDLVKTGVMPRWAYVSCLTRCLPGQEAVAYERVRQLIAASVPEFQLTTLTSSVPGAPQPATVLAR